MHNSRTISTRQVWMNPKTMAKSCFIIMYTNKNRLKHAQSDVLMQSTHTNANEQLIMSNPHLSWLETPPCEASESQNMWPQWARWLLGVYPRRAVRSNIDHHLPLSTDQMCDLLANQPKPKLNTPAENQVSLRGEITNLKSLWTVIRNY